VGIRTGAQNPRHEIKWGQPEIISTVIRLSFKKEEKKKNEKVKGHAA
jgi:hypothetical protein